jgi:hypothetical protein
VAVEDVKRSHYDRSLRYDSPSAGTFWLWWRTFATTVAASRLPLWRLRLWCRQIATRVHAAAATSIASLFYCLRAVLVMVLGLVMLGLV